MQEQLAAVPSKGTPRSTRTASQHGGRRPQRHEPGVEPLVEVTFRGIEPDEDVVQALRRRVAEGDEPTDTRWRMIIEHYRGTVEAWLECNLPDRTVIGHGIAEAPHEAALHALRRFAPDVGLAPSERRGGSGSARQRDAN